VPGATLPTVNVIPPARVPVEIVHVEIVLGVPIMLSVPVTLHDVSVDENPIPLMVTLVKIEPEVGDRLIAGGIMVTVKEA
jgi:hypothetical protein